MGESHPSPDTVSGRLRSRLHATHCQEHPPHAGLPDHCASTQPAGRLVSGLIRINSKPAQPPKSSIPRSQNTSPAARRNKATARFRSRRHRPAHRPVRPVPSHALFKTSHLSGTHRGVAPSPVGRPPVPGRLACAACDPDPRPTGTNRGCDHSRDVGQLISVRG